MSRSNFAVPFIDSCIHAPYIANGKVGKYGFERTEYDDGEEVFFKVSEELNVIQYLKFDFALEVFIFSAWIKFIDDTEKHREYRLEHFSDNAKETEDLYTVINELVEFYGDRLRLKTFYVYE